MGQYILRRLLLLLPTLFGMSLLVFLLMRLLPGDPVSVMFGTREPPDDVREAIRNQLHLNDPMVIQYTKWLGDLVTGDFGSSMITRQPISDQVLLALKVTTSLACLSMLIAILIGIPVGIIAAIWKGTWIEYGALGFSLLGVSTPSFFLGTLLILIFGQELQLFPTIGYAPFAENPVKWLHHLALPSLALGVTAAASIARMIRASLLEVLQLDYVRTARAKGLGSRVVVLRHVLPNALLPTLTLIGMQFGALLGGAAIIEMVFALPGLGRTALVAIVGRDYPVIQITVLLSALVFVLVNLLTDVLYAVVDPRIRQQQR
jgi:peptide/nickel transport system permease protein